mgnify:CR=1 FL=1
MDEAMMVKPLKSLDEAIRDETMLVPLERPVKRGRKPDWDEPEHTPGKITVTTSTDLMDLGVLELSADYKVPMGGKLVERTAAWWVSASSIGLEIMAKGGRYARASLDGIGAVGTRVGMSGVPKWRNVRPLAKLVPYHCRAMSDFSATRHIASPATL